MKNRDMSHVLGDERPCGGVGPLVAALRIDTHSVVFAMKRSRKTCPRNCIPLAPSHITASNGYIPIAGACVASNVY